MAIVQQTSPRVEAEQMSEPFQGQPITVRARIANEDGTFPLQADFGSGTLNVYRLSETGSQSTPIHTDTLVISTVLSDSLQTGSEWTLDSTGYNFKHVLDVSSNEAFEVAGSTYLVEMGMLGRVLSLTEQPVAQQTR